MLKLLERFYTVSLDRAFTVCSEMFECDCFRTIFLSDQIPLHQEGKQAETTCVISPPKASARIGVATGSAHPGLHTNLQTIPKNFHGLFQWVVGCSGRSSGQGHNS